MEEGEVVYQTEEGGELRGHQHLSDIESSGTGKEGCVQSSSLRGRQRHPAQQSSRPSSAQRP